MGFADGQGHTAGDTIDKCSFEAANAPVYCVSWSNFGWRLDLECACIMYKYHSNAVGRSFLGCLVLITAAVNSGAADDYYTEQQVYGSRPQINREMEVGHIGPTGIVARVYRNAILKVESTEEGTPAHGLFERGDVITGVNGTPHQGRNLFVVLGNAITKAEATDGKLVFDVEREGDKKEIAVKIPVLGSYSKTWPLDCPKSKRIIDAAAAYYSNAYATGERGDKGVAGGLMCLFLLSTGDDRHVPVVKKYFESFIKNPAGIGDHTWNNGYNGIAVCEYYLRTGDRDVMPVIQYYCDNARDRQKFDCGWPHWGRGINPGYCGAGIMNPASTQILTTLLLAKECGAEVDEKTLLNSLRFFYRFVGHGTVPYGNDRAEGGLGSNGKDSMLAAAMQVACGAQGDTTIYQGARDHLSMATITNYPVLVRGHADEGRGDGMWRGIASSYLIDKQGKDYRAVMDRLTWWYDLSRYANGGLGIATCQRFNDIGSGAGVALGYTAPLKTLRITGAPRSKFAVDFALPERLWGKKADLSFLEIEHNPSYYKYGGDEPTHIPFYLLGSAYSKPSMDPKEMDREVILKNIYHRRYMIRAQAAKALRAAGHLSDLEKLLSDKDPRVRRAALDGIIDYRYWFSMGHDPLKTEQYTPGMIEAIVTMLKDPDEALYVVDGALFAMRNMPARVIQENIDAIIPWTKHEEWWLRESSFVALFGLEKDEELFVKVLPTLMAMVSDEYHTHPRGNMMWYLKRQVNQDNLETAVGRIIVAGLVEAAKTAEVKEGLRSAEGAHNVYTAVQLCLEKDPSTAITMATMIKQRFDVLNVGQMIKIIATPNSNREGKPFGLYTLLEKQSDAQRKELTDLLYNDYRRELLKRMETEGIGNQALVNSIIDLTQLKDATAGWQAIGSPKPADRVWHYLDVDPMTEKDVMHRREKKRFRDISLAKDLAGWFLPDFDASKWQSGKAPIGKGEFSRGGRSFENQSFWGYGEFLLMRTTFEMESLDYDVYRLSVLANQGFHIYLNGHKIHTYVWWKTEPHYRLITLGENETEHLKKGTNTLAVYTNTEYPYAMNRRNKVLEVGQIDCFIEGLRKADLQAEAANR